MSKKPQKQELTPYQQKLLDPRWQKKRLEILERDEWKCQRCDATDRTLAVHHRVYIDNAEPWDVPNIVLETLCEQCHEGESKHRKDAEKHLNRALRTMGVPWWALDKLTESLLKNLPPLSSKEAYTVFSYFIQSVPVIVDRTGIGRGFAEYFAQDSPEEEQG